MAVRAEIFEERDRWGPWLGISTVLHVGLTAAIVFTGWINFHKAGENWGGDTSGGGGAMSATLVSAVPLPHPPGETQSVLATESKGLSQLLSSPQVQASPDAIAIPDKQAKNKNKQVKPAPPHDDRRKPPVEEAKNNVIPYGEGGAPGSMYSTAGTNFAMGNTKGGISMGAGGDFGNRYSYYVD